MSDNKSKVSCFILCYFCISIGETYIIYALGLYAAIGDGYKHMQTYMCRYAAHMFILIIYQNHCIVQ